MHWWSKLEAEKFEAVLVAEKKTRTEQCGQPELRLELDLVGTLLAIASWHCEAHCLHRSPPLSSLYLVGHCSIWDGTSSAGCAMSGTGTSFKQVLHQ